MKEKKKLVVVLGMHRSGTSVIARGLKVLGVELGDNLLPPAEDNPTGFWEDLDFYTINIEMLDFLDRDWHFLTPIQHQDLELLHKNGYLLRAVELLREKTNGVQVFGLKDPRLAKLLPFWKEVFGESRFNVSYVLVIRHPLSVSNSLTKRNGFDAEKNYLLWLDHVISSLLGTTGEKRALIDYDCLMEEPEVELAKVARALRLTIDPVELNNFKTEFLDEQLRHTIHHASDLSLDETVPPLVREMYPELLRAAISYQQFDSKAFQHKIGQWTGEFSRMRAALVLADKFTRKINSLDQKEQMLMAKIAEKEQQLADRDMQLANMKTQLDNVYLSNSWRMTAPIRAVGEKLRRLRECRGGCC